MLTETLRVRFYETDALKHVSNTVVAGWFEAAREPIFRYFTPDLKLDNWPLILASYKIDFLKQIFYGESVEIRTGIKRIGGASFTVFQQVWQSEQCCAEGETVMVNFDYQQNKSVSIPQPVREKLSSLLIGNE